MTNFRTLLLAGLLALLAACSDEKSAAPAEAASKGVGPHSRLAADAAAIPKIPEAKRVATREFQCAVGGPIKLDDYDDSTTRVTINGVTHILRTVNVDGGALLQGDNISIRLAGDQTTASQNGIVLSAGCKPDGKPG